MRKWVECGSISWIGHPIAVFGLHVSPVRHILSQGCGSSLADADCCRVLQADATGVTGECLP